MPLYDLKSTPVSNELFVPTGIILMKKYTATNSHKTFYIFLVKMVKSIIILSLIKKTTKNRVDQENLMRKTKNKIVRN